MLGVAIGLVVGGGRAADPGRIWSRTSLPVPALFALYPWPLAKAGAVRPAWRPRPSRWRRSAGPARRRRRRCSASNWPRTCASAPETVGALLAAVGLAALAVATAPTPLAAAIMIAGVAAAFVALWAARRRSARGWLARPRSVTAAPAGSASPTSPAALGRPHRRAGDRARRGPAGGGGADPVEPDRRGDRRRAAQPRRRWCSPRSPGDQGPAFDAAVARGLRPAADARRTTCASPSPPAASPRCSGGRSTRADRPERPLGLRHRHLASRPSAPSRRVRGVVSGRWWPANYAGPPLVALDDEAAKGGGAEGGRRDHVSSPRAATSRPASRRSARSTSAASAPTSPWCSIPRRWRAPTCARWPSPRRRRREERGSPARSARPFPTST